MPISGSNLKLYLSGGAANTDPDLSFGGDLSSTVMPTGFFDPVTGDEAAAGDVEYRLVYVRNEDADSDGWIAPVVWITAQAAIATYALGIADAGKNASETAVANENTAPASVSFSAPTTKGAGLALPGAPYAQNDYVGIWIRRTITAGASSAASDPFSFRVEGDTI